MALTRLVSRGAIRRLAPGLYDYPKSHPVIGTLAPSADAIAKALVGRHNIRLFASGAYAANLLGLSEQVPAKIVVRAVVRIEMGARSDHWPSQPGEISSYVAQQFPAAFQQPSFAVKVLAVERTFWEKATLLHAEFHRPADKGMPLRLSRHYYDFFRMIESGLGDKAAQDLELLSRVVQHKRVFFRNGWAHYQTAKQGCLRLSPAPERFKPLEADYDKMQEMFFGDRPAFTDILQVLGKWEHEFNRVGSSTGKGTRYARTPNTGRTAMKSSSTSGSKPEPSSRSRLPEMSGGREGRRCSTALNHGDLIS